MSDAWLAFILALQAAAPGDVPPQAEDLPARAVDHVVRMEGDRYCADCDPYRLTVVRSGPWVRQEGVSYNLHQIHHSDFESRTSFSIARDRSDRFEWLDVQRPNPAEARYWLRRTPTGRHVTRLGEPCEIWSMTAPHRDRDSCETEDGVQLWNRQLSEGRPVNFAVALSVERRPVRPEEVRPPADFFSLMPSLAAAAIDEAAAFEVQYEFGRGRNRVDELFRRSGRQFFSRRRSDDGAVEYRGSDGQLGFSYDVGADGRPIRFHVWSIDEDRRDSPTETWAPVPGRRWRLLYGERCRWQQLVEDERVDEPYQCRTESGIPLMIETRPADRVPIVYRARSLRRGRLEATAFAIPAAATDWAVWGVQPSP